MNQSGCNRVRWTAAVAFFIACLLLVAVFAFSQGKASAERRAEVQIANDGAFQALYTLIALKEPESEKWQTLFQVSLDGWALKLSEVSLTHPELISNRNYNLLVQARKYLEQHGKAPDRNPGLRPVEQVTAKISEAIAKLEALHPDVQRWEAEESGRASTSVLSK